MPFIPQEHSYGMVERANLADEAVAEPFPSKYVEIVKSVPEHYRAIISVHFGQKSVPGLG